MSADAPIWQRFWSVLFWLPAKIAIALIELKFKIGFYTKSELAELRGTQFNKGFMRGEEAERNLIIREVTARIDSINKKKEVMRDRGFGGQSVAMRK